MKKVLIALFALTLTAGAFAQDSTNGTNNLAQTNITQKHNMQNHDGVILKNGKMLVMKKGQTMPLTEDLVLTDGTTVMANGTLKMKDGTTATLQEGDYVKMDGTRGNIMKMKKDNMSKENSMPDKMKTDTLR